ncbi:HIT-like protein [Cutaneotrichosporon oleaginosum]|uniref:HIT-like protein n=1 Tax=Cutaneotrichosporon oleaginosum TaxID=879819 RepID=A0A0J0XX28_9TREE|nr:HIT-like protein [Cutaneotrichosporon oleaginosum]KLT45610.1 HIT-like protein [Cutaneotrichosporon oleaginosum]
MSDAELIAFRDRWPRAAGHLLVIPRQHIGPVLDLTREHVGLKLLESLAALDLTRMKERGLALAPGATKLGFHIPPFSSVHHIHLHVFTPPFTTLGKLMYPVRQHAHGKGWSWFVSVDQAITVLERGDRIRLRRC